MEGIYEYDLIKDKNGMACLTAIKEIKGKDINTIDKVVSILKKSYKIHQSYIEKSYLAVLNDGKLIGLYNLSRGDNSSCDMPPGIVLLVTMMLGGNEFAVFHNHPDGALYPSEEDIEIKVNFQILAQMLNLNFAGSIIITNESWISIVEGIEDLK